MNQNEKLSLQEEVENEALRVEKEIADNPELKDIKVSDRMEAALLAKIQAYEKKNEQKHSTEDNMVKIVEEHTPNFNVSTKDKPESFLSEEDREALRLGREMMKKKEDEATLFEVNTEYHKHLNSEKKEGKKNRGGKTGVFRMPRGRRFAIAFVAVLVLVVGTSVTSVGSKSYLKDLFNDLLGNQKTQKINVKDMDIQETEDGDELTAYREVREKVGTLSVRLGYKPVGMRLKRYKIDQDQKSAKMFYSYNHEIIRFDIYLNNSDSSLNQKEEDELIDEFPVDTEKQTINVKEYSVSQSPDSRFIADFEYKGVRYQLKGIMEKEDFEEIVKNLTYF